MPLEVIKGGQKQGKENLNNTRNPPGAQDIGDADTKMAKSIACL